jgi:glucose-1-phosphate thymidylyltransferase
MGQAQDFSGGELIGLLPAGGQAVRISPLPCSKELYPIGFRPVEDGKSRRPKVVAHYLLEKMRYAGFSKAYIVLRPGKWDIPAYFGDGSMLDMHLGYLMLGAPYGVPFTLDQAYSFVKHATVAFGFPDILFDSDDGFVRLIERQSASHSDITLGLFSATHAQSKEDRVNLQSDGSVREIVLGPPTSDLLHTWAIAVWKPSFTQFLHDFVASKKSADAQRFELSAGHALQAGIEAGLRADAVVLNDTPYLDVGTPDNLYKAVKRSL